MLLEGIQSEDLCKIRSSSGVKKTSGVDAEEALQEIPDPTPESVYWGFSTTQWLMVGGIVVGLLGLYYKREEIKATHANLFNTTPAPSVGTTVDTPGPNVGTTADTTSANVGAKALSRASGISKMD